MTIVEVMLVVFGVATLVVPEVGIVVTCVMYAVVTDEDITAGVMYAVVDGVVVACVIYVACVIDAAVVACVIYAVVVVVRPCVVGGVVVGCTYAFEVKVLVVGSGVFCAM